MAPIKSHNVIYATICFCCCCIWFSIVHVSAFALLLHNDSNRDVNINKDPLPSIRDVGMLNGNLPLELARSNQANDVIDNKTAIKQQQQQANVTFSRDDKLLPTSSGIGRSSSDDVRVANKPDEQGPMNTMNLIGVTKSQFASANQTNYDSNSWVSMKTAEAAQVQAAPTTTTPTTTTPPSTKPIERGTKQDDDGRATKSDNEPNNGINNNDKDDDEFTATTMLINYDDQLLSHVSSTSSPISSSKSLELNSAKNNNASQKQSKQHSSLSTQSNNQAAIITSIVTVDDDDDDGYAIGKFNTNSSNSNDNNDNDDINKQGKNDEEASHLKLNVNSSKATTTILNQDNDNITSKQQVVERIITSNRKRLAVKSTKSDVSDKLTSINSETHELEFGQFARDLPDNSNEINSLSNGNKLTNALDRISELGQTSGNKYPNDANNKNIKEVDFKSLYGQLLKKKILSRYWTAEQKWDDLYHRAMKLQDLLKNDILRAFLKDFEYYADLAISKECANDFKFVQEYAKNSTNFRWLLHMIDSLGKGESGQLTGNVASLGHVVQCIRVRAPRKHSNETFEDRFFDAQTELLGERFRGKYCLASIRPVMPNRPNLISRFNQQFDLNLLSNISFSGQPTDELKQKLHDVERPDLLYDIETNNNNNNNTNQDQQIPFESEFYQFLIDDRNFMFSLPQFLGICVPSSCSRDDVRFILQKNYDDQHQVVDMEFECEMDELSVWQWFNMPRLISYVFLGLIIILSFTLSFTRYILVDKLGFERVSLDPLKRPKMHTLLYILELTSMDKCAGLLFVKTKLASTKLDETKLENCRSTSIDALKGALILALIYSQLTMLGCLPVPFMWSKWGDAMFPFYRAPITQLFLNSAIWSDAFYLISGYIICLKLLQNYTTLRDSTKDNSIDGGDKMTLTGKFARPYPNFATFALNRYLRLVLPTGFFILLSYVWPRLSNGFVMQDQANSTLR